MNSRSALRRLWLLAVGASAAAILLLAPAAQAVTPAPHFAITSMSTVSHFTPGDNSGAEGYIVKVTNTGGAATDGSPITISDVLPPGVTLDAAAVFPITFQVLDDTNQPAAGASCDPGPPVTCVATTSTLHPGMTLTMWAPVHIAANAPATVVNTVSVSGGGTPGASAVEHTPVSGTPAGVGFQSLATSITGIDGTPVTQAGAHPYQFHTEFQLNTVQGAGQDAPAGTPRDIRAVLPEGMVVNPNATNVRCTEAQLENINPLTSAPSCPAASAVGIVHPTVAAFGATNSAFTSPLYNMVPPPGVPAAFGFDAASLGIFVHLLGGVDTAGNYELTADAKDIPQYGFLSGISVDLWGNPTDPSHDFRRARCAIGVVNLACPTDPVDAPLLTMPSACSGPLTTTITTNSWEDPGTFISGSSQTQDSAGNPAPVTGCDKLDFNPTLTAQPDTPQADSPSGLDVDLKVPQNNSNDALATANLKRAIVDLPAGMAVNPSIADGLEVCSPAEIGLHTAAQPSCPDGSKIGTVDVTTPLLADHLTGSVYLAKQTDNPFGTLLALYLTAERDGALIKLAGKVEPDPQTGQLKATFAENPQLPFSDFALHFKGGPRGALVTPPTCGIYQTSSKLSPWSAADPDNPTAAEIKTSTSSFEITSGPGGGPCPDYTDPNRFTPGFSAGTTVPLAGSGTGFNLKVTRSDGQQSLKRIHLDLPPGVVAKLAGIPRCSQSAIQTGVDGHANCPSSSQIGIVNAGAGAGSTPFFLKDQPVYLTDGYNGAPYGIVIDTHAKAGPFDLGHVVVRSTLNVDPDDAQVHIDSEEIPWIVQGIPLHIRQISVNVNRPGFMVNPTNCEPMEVTGTVTGGGADFDAPGDDTTKPVADHFQLGGCGALGFSPKLSGAILNGQEGIHRSDHPNLAFNLHATPGDANLARVEVTLPQAFQIDQANLGNICSETQLATEQCAGRNTVGSASATTPLLDSTLSGPVYAVSGSGGLPKLAVILNGPAADPVNLLVRGITTTVGARIANTFPLVPDTPITDFNLTLNGGPAGYLVNNTNVCGETKKVGGKRKGKKARKSKKRKRFVPTPLVADAHFVAQNGDTLDQAVPIAAQCPKAKKAGKRKKGRARR